MESEKYEIEARKWVENNFGCKFRKKSAFFLPGGRRIVPDALSTNKSRRVCADTKAGDSTDEGIMLDMMFSIIKLAMIEKARKSTYLKLLIVEDKRKAQTYLKSMKFLSLFTVIPKLGNNFEVWYYNGNGGEERLFPSHS